MSFPINGILDNFNRANENPLNSTNWGEPFSPAADSLQIVTNQVTTQVGTSGYCENYWKTTFGPGIECYFLISTIQTTNDIYIDVIIPSKISSSTPSGYNINVSKQAGTDVITLARQDNGVFTTLGTFNQEVSSADSIGISFIAGVLTGYYKSGAGAWASLGSANDSTYSGTFYLCFGSDNELGGLSIFDNFGGGGILNISPSALSLTLNLPSTTHSVLKITAPLSGNLALPSVSISKASVKNVPVSPLSLSISVVGPVPAISILPAPLSLASSLIAPIKSITINPNPLSITSALIAPTKTVQFIASALAATLSLQSSTTIVNVSPNALQATLNLPGAIPMVINVPGSLPITLLLNPVTVSVPGLKIVVVGPLSLSISVVGVNPTVAINPNPLSAQLSLQTASTEAKVSPNALTASLALGTSTKECKSIIGPLSLTSLLGGVTPQALMTPNALTINFLLNNPAIALAFNKTIIVAPLTLTLSLGVPTVLEVYRQIRIATHNQQPKNSNKINALRRITKANAVNNQTHSGL